MYTTCTVWYHLYVLLFLCVCELQRGYSISILLGQQYAGPYPNPAPWPPKLILQHNLDAVTFDTTRYTEHTARPSNSTRQSHLFCWSFHCPRICCRHALARKSIVSSLFLSFPIDFRSATIQLNTAVRQPHLLPVVSRPENLSSSRYYSLKIRSCLLLSAFSLSILVQHGDESE